MLDIETLSPGDELSADTPVLCCGGVMDTAGTTRTCRPGCGSVIETRNGLIFNIRD